MNSRILPTLALIVSVGIFFAYVQPTWSGSIYAAKASIASNDRALAAAKTYTLQQNQLAAARNAIDPTDLAQLARLLPSSVDNVGLILDLNALAARSGLTLSNIDVITNTIAPAKSGGVGVALSAATGPTGSAELSLSAVGTYAALQSFLVGVEKSERLLDVKDLLVRGSDTGVYDYRMKLSFYWLR